MSTHPSARKEALALLARRALSRAELERALEQRGHGAAVVEDAVATVAAWGYLDDRAIADRLIEEARSSGRGRVWVKNRLERRGVDADLAEHAAAAAEDGAAERARHLVERRFGPVHALDRDDRRRAYRFLIGRGFDPESCAALLGPEAE